VVLSRSTDSRPGRAGRTPGGSAVRGPAVRGSEVGDDELPLGLAMALNEQLALTMSLQHSLTDFTRQEANGERRRIVASDLNGARPVLGGSDRMSPVTTVNPNVGLGITEDAPDFQIELSVPLRLPYEFSHL